MSDEAPVRVERRGRVAVWTIDRPAAMNALSRATIRELGRLAREVADDRAIRAVIITGEGEKAFCAGADLKERRGMSEDEVRDVLGLYRAMWGFIDRCPKPVVAAINGLALGGGLELALACDLRVVASTAVVGLTEVSLAIIPGGGGTQRLTRLVGEARAKEMLLFSQRLGAEEALASGLVHRVAEPGRSTLDEALAWIAPLSEAAPVAMEAALAAVDGAADLPLEAGLAFENRCYERVLQTRDRIEALEAFAEKRKPIYRGE